MAFTYCTREQHLLLQIHFDPSWMRLPAYNLKSTYVNFLYIIILYTQLNVSPLEEGQKSS